MTGITTPISAWISGGPCWPACSGTSSARSPRMCGAPSNEQLTKVNLAVLTCLLACVHASLWHLTACLQSGNIEGREKRCDAAGRDINVLGAVNKDTITRGLRYSIATGNWGVQGATGIRPGVSQVSNPLHAACFPAVNNVTGTQDRTCSAVWDGMPAAHSRSLGLPDVCRLRHCVTRFS